MNWRNLFKRKVLVQKLIPLGDGKDHGPQLTYFIKDRFSPVHGLMEEGWYIHSVHIQGDRTERALVVMERYEYK